MKDCPISMAQFEAMEALQKHRDGFGRRKRLQEKRNQRQAVERALLEAKARDLGIAVVLGYPEVRRTPWRVHHLEVNDEISLQVDHQGAYAYVALDRRGAYRGRFTPEEVLILMEALRTVRLPYRAPHKSRAKKKDG